MERWGRLVSVVVALGVLGFTSEASASEKWGPFRGQVVDIETGQPIEGAVVLVVWWEIIPSPIHTTEKFYEAREAVTGPDGRFEIPRLSAPPWQLGIQPPNIEWFAPGYAHVKLVVTPPGGEPFVASTVIQMRRLKTRDERRNAILHSRLPPGGVPHEKMLNLLKALNRELSGKETEPYSLGGTR